MIGVVLLVFLTWGPQKIPELARAVGQARNEFVKASRGYQQDTEHAGLTSLGQRSSVGESVEDEA